MIVNGKLIDIKNREIYNASIVVKGNKIDSIKRLNENVNNLPCILPGFIDAHVHIESSMLTPTEFARLAVTHGTVATVSDPHEIGNVLGVKGVEFMIENSKLTPFKFYFGAPSCVPATSFETSGASITVSDVDYLLQKPEILYLAEMMNWPGVLNKDLEVISKIRLAQKYNKPVDGHAPGLLGEQAKQYIDAGITTDHECFTYDEARNKLDNGMKVIIREGSAAKNFEALIELLDTDYLNIMFCSDDKHPDSLIEGHINELVKRALNRGLGLFKVLQVACLNPIKHYNLDVGQLRVGDDADFITIDNLNSFNVTNTYIKGQHVAQNGKSLLHNIPSLHPNNFKVEKKAENEFKQKNTTEIIPVIEVIDGELITNRLNLKAKVENGLNISDISRDILKITVVNRYNMNAKPSISFIKNFGLKNGAIASSVGHDSHNIICIGVDDVSMTKAINLIIEAKGGISAVSNRSSMLLELPIGGLMTDKDGYEIANQYIMIDKMVKAMGCDLTAPFMSLSFMALLVIPSLKLSDLGLFDGMKFQFI